MQVIGCAVTVVNQSAAADVQTRLLQDVHPRGRKTSSTWAQWDPQRSQVMRRSRLRQRVRRQSLGVVSRLRCHESGSGKELGQDRVQRRSHSQICLVRKIRRRRPPKTLRTSQIRRLRRKSRHRTHRLQIRLLKTHHHLIRRLCHRVGSCTESCTEESVV